MQQGSPTILVVEDSDEDFEALQRSIKQANFTDIPLKRCVDGDEALELLQETVNQPQSMRPSLILLDLNLPGTDGREIIQEIKQDAVLKSIPIVVLTTSSNPKDIEACYALGVNSYMLKPMDTVQLRQSIQGFLNYWFTIAVLPDSVF